MSLVIPHYITLQYMALHYSTYGGQVEPASHNVIDFLSNQTNFQAKTKLLRNCLDNKIMACGLSLPAMSAHFNTD